MLKICKEAGLEWRPLRYHRNPPVVSSVYDTSRLVAASERLYRSRHFEVVHCRSYIPAIAGLRLKRRANLALLFDMRGFWPDERVEGGSWNLANPLYRYVYRYFKKLELQLLESSDHIICLTDAGKKQLLTRAALSSRPAAEVSVIPCAVDFAHFPLAESWRATSRQALAIQDDVRVVGYLGSLGAWYMLDEMLDFFRVYQDQFPTAHLLFVTMENPQAIISAAEARGIGADRVIVRSATRDEVPRLMAAADVGISFIKPVFSKTASSPTKVGEMLALGLPVVANAGVGDVDQVLVGTGLGAVVRDFSQTEYQRAIGALETRVMTPDEIRAKAATLFDLKAAVDRYSAIYDLLRERLGSEARRVPPSISASSN